MSHRMGRGLAFGLAIVLACLGASGASGASGVRVASGAQEAPEAPKAPSSQALESLARRADYRRLQIEMLRLGPMHKLRAAQERERAAKRAHGKPAAPKPGARATAITPDDLPAQPPIAPWLTPLSAQAAAAIPANARCNDPSGDGTTAAQSETAIAALGGNVVVAWNDGQGFNSVPYGEGQGFGWSANGGATFTDGGAIPHPAAYPSWIWTSDPVLAVNEKTGDFWYCGLASPGGANGTTNAIAVARGRFTGGAFAFDSTFVVRMASSSSVFLDKQWLAVDSLTGNLYVSNTTFTTSGDQIDFYRSTDGGRTWGASVMLSSAADAGLVQGSRVAVGPNGEVHAVWSALETDPAVDTDHFRYRRSTDSGASFGPEVTCVDHISNFGTGAPGFNRNRGITFPGIAVDRARGAHRGRVYLSWNESYDWLDDPFPATTTAGIGRSEVESNGTTATATSATLGQVLRGTLTTTAGTRDQDYFAIPLTAGQHVIVYADSFTATRAFTLRLFAPAPDGAQMLAYGGKTDSTAATITSVVWTYTAPVSGTYYLRVAAASWRSMGYRVRTVAGARGAERGRDQRDLFVTRSDDGVAWAAPVRVNDDAIGYDDYLPEVAVGGDGLPYVAAYDFRDDTYGSRANVYLSRSADGGATWAGGARLSNTSTNFTTAATNMAPNMGDYLALGSGGAGVFAAWADGRGANLDVYAAGVPTGAAIASGPADTTMSAAGAADFGWSLTNANTQFSGAYTAHFTSERAWVMPADAVVNVPAGGAAWRAITVAVPDSASSGTNRVCVTLTGPGGVTVGQDCFSIAVLASPLGVDGGALAFSLGTSTPNPARGHAGIAWSLPRNGRARLAVFDLSGARVRTLVDGAAAAGRNVTWWDGRDDGGRAVRAGAYFWSLEFEGRRLARRMVIVR